MGLTRSAVASVSAQSAANAHMVMYGLVHIQPARSMHKAGPDHAQCMHRLLRSAAPLHSCRAEAMLLTSKPKRAS